MVILYKGTNAYIASIPLLAAILVYSFSIGEANGQASVVVTPTCGPPSVPGGEGHEEGEGFNITYNATGFIPNGIVHWKLIHANGTEATAQFGSFETDANGSFSEPTYIGEGLT